MISLGKRAESAKYHCNPANSTAPPPPPTPDCTRVAEQFNNLGSWMVTFGLGALAAALVLLVFSSLAAWARGGRAPRLHLRVMALPGMAAGLLWSVGNFSGLYAAKLEMASDHGDAVAMAQMMALQLIVSGLWGILYYHEMGGRQAQVWCGMAGFTLVAMVLLGGEKAE